MQDLLFVVPLLVGLAIIALGFKFQVSKGPAMNRPAFGAFLVLGSLCWWLSTAILLVYEGKFYFIINVLTVLTFFMGLASFIPLPEGAARTNLHRLPGLILVWLGLILGFAHALALTLADTWPARLLEFYAKLGLHSTPPPAL
ncbi:hypothetical protein [Verrucomicrobium sp. BvORR106]|uniref:hypothetical protein n=1 Tax=Verrucomicrobium sp. BvORR106 TaxID=1403819 RepID=UPI00056DD084|nr:hypothetical protein [Verrucomicrobium sp. BvORR106]